MKKILLFIISLQAILYSCNTESSSQINLNKIVSLQTDVSPLKFIESNEYLDLDASIDKINNEETELSAEDIAKLKAIAYRFYSNTQVKDSAYVINTTAKDIQVSDKVFNAMKKNIEEINDFIKENNQKGIKSDISGFNHEMFISNL